MSWSPAQSTVGTRALWRPHEPVAAERERGARGQKGPEWGLESGPGPTGSPRVEGEESVLSLDRKTNDPIMGA